MKAKLAEGEKGVGQTVPGRSRIVVVEDHPMMRQALKEVIDRQTDLTTCGEASDIASAVKVIAECRPDLVLLDLSLGEESGLELIRKLMDSSPATLVLVLSMYDESLYAERAVRAGAKGYLNKRESAATIMSAIRGVLKGDIYLGPSVINRVLQRLSGHTTVNECADVERLSDREMKTFELIGEGLGSREIARRLNVSVKTVEAYRERIKAKLGVIGSPELARRAVEWVLRGH